MRLDGSSENGKKGLTINPTMADSKACDRGCGEAATWDKAVTALKACDRAATATSKDEDFERNCKIPPPRVHAKPLPQIKKWSRLCLLFYLRNSAEVRWAGDVQLADDSTARRTARTTKPTMADSNVETLCDKSAARWYLKTADGGYGHAMYNFAVCCSFGESYAQIGDTLESGRSKQLIGIIAHLDSSSYHIQKNGSNRCGEVHRDKCQDVFVHCTYTYLDGCSKKSRFYYVFGYFTTFIKMVEGCD